MNFTHAAKIAGYVFNDLNANGVNDGEPPISGTNVTLQKNNGNGGLIITQTLSDGTFAFNSITKGLYTICANPPSSFQNWIPTRPECLNIKLNGKNSSAFASFAYVLSYENNGCTRTQGYWGSSPAGKLRLIELVGSGLSLGNRTYTATEMASIFNTPAGGNALISLAHQLMAAKLNILNGTNNSQVGTFITQAENLIANLIIPPIGSDFVANSSTLGQQMDVVKTALDDYNNGKLDVPKCP